MAELTQKEFVNLSQQTPIYIINDNQWHALKDVKRCAVLASLRLFRVGPHTYGRKHQRCVVCGTRQNITKHHIFPKKRLKETPINRRPKNTTNIFLLCTSCHKRYHKKSSLKDGCPQDFLADFYRVMQPKFVSQLYSMRVK